MSEYQYCMLCSGKTDKCQEDRLYLGSADPLCESCYDEIMMEAGAILQTRVKTLQAKVERLEVEKEILLIAGSDTSCPPSRGDIRCDIYRPDGECEGCWSDHLASLDMGGLTAELEVANGGNI